MLSISRSRLANPTQLLFLGLNAVALLLATIYSSKSPDLYAGSTHHTLGWISIWVVLAQTLTTLVKSFGGRAIEGRKWTPISFAAMEHHRQAHSSHSQNQRECSHRPSPDEEVGTPRNNSISGTTDCEEDFPHHTYDTRDVESELEFTEKGSLLGNSAVKRLFTRIPINFLRKTLQAIEVVRNVIQYTILLFGFLTITTGVVVYGGIFVSSCGSTHTPFSY